MYTLNYKGVYIHGYLNSEQCHVQFPNCTTIAKNLRAAKIAVTKFKQKKTSIIA